MSNQTDFNTSPIDYKFIKAEAARIRQDTGEKCRTTDLIALAPQNDPFYTGTPAEMDGARWFAALWQRFGYERGVHLRRVHYQIVSQDETIEMPNGTPYANDLNSWGYLTKASKWARYLNLVPAGAFVDRRNPDAKTYARFRPTNPHDINYIGEPRYKVGDKWEYQDFESYNPDLPDMPTLPDMPHFNVYGYRQPDQDYLVEVWAEKTTQNDILVPLCNRMGVNLVTGAGELSITAVFEFLQRAREAGKPARILYVSDYDPAGLGMPVSVARKVEFYQRNFGFDDLDIALEPIVLTAEQVDTYRLPRVPVKKSDKRRENWIETHGAGQVELDALEALHTGELARVVTEAASQYIDTDLNARANDTSCALYAAITDTCEQWETDHADELREMRDSYISWRAGFSALWEAFLEAPEARAHMVKLQDIKDQLAGLRDEIIDHVESEIDLDDYPLPTPELPPETNGKLYESGRDYFTQLDYYKAHQNGE
jgi:hypothetical protein